MDKINVIIPTYKESDNVSKLIYNINKNLWTYIETVRFIIVDDTPDNSLEELVQGTRITYMKGAGNYGNSLIKGILRSGDIGDYNKLIIMDIDHPFHKIIEMIDMLDKHDMVIGCDLNENGERLVTKYILRKLFGITIPHPTCGFMGFKSDVLGYKAFNFRTIKFHRAMSKKDIIHVELLYMCIKNKLDIGILNFDTTETDIKHNYSIKRNIIWLKDVANMFFFDKVFNWYNQ